MRALARRAAALFSSPLALATFLLALCIVAYAPLITRLGFYWDDFPISWIAATMGGEGLERYFSTNRPVWGLLYRVTMALLGSRPLVWQVFALLMRWAAGMALWAVLRLTWSGGGKSAAARSQFAAWAAVLFVIYPGFSQHFGAFVYSHFYIVLLAFLLSLACMLLALRLPPSRRVWKLPLTLAALLLGLFNLLSMEYFFLLDLLRPILIWFALEDRGLSARSRLRATLLAWLPYLAVFIGAMFWRSVLFGFHTYQPAFLTRLRENPFAAVAALLPLILRDSWLASAAAWAKAFVYPSAQAIGQTYLIRYWILVAGGALMSLVFLLLYRPFRARGEVQRQTAPLPASDWRFAWRARFSWAWQPVAVGALALLLGGGPFWLTDLPVTLVFPNDRFTLGFMLGACLIAAGLLTILRLPLLNRLVPVLLAVGLGFAVGLQFQNAIAYNREWSMQRSMFWQILWRMPYIEPGTALLTNELPMLRYTDNSLTAPLNWIYEPANSDPLTMDYAVMYPTLRRAVTQRNLQKDRAFSIDYLASTFYGSTNQLVILYYNPPGCLRVLDPQVDALNWTVPGHLRESLSATTTAPILPAAPEGRQPPTPPRAVFGDEIARGWCYYFQKADLARQMEDWQTIDSLGDEAFAIGDYPNDPAERFPFIEGYAHTGNWQRAQELTRESYAVSNEVMRPLLCRLWERINDEVPESVEKDAATQQIQGEMGCTAPPSVP